MKAKVYFIGAGPGDPELITVRGQRLIREADLVLYAGSLVPLALVREVKPGARVEDSSPLSLDQTHALIMDCVNAGGTVARVHTGEPALYGAVSEQMDLLEAEGVGCEIVPGVTAAFAVADLAKVPLTVPGGPQTMIITRTPGRTPMPGSEDLEALASHGSSMAIYLSARAAPLVREKLLAAGLAPDTPVVVAHRAGWPDQTLVESTVDGLAQVVDEHGFNRQTMFLVLPGGHGRKSRSKLYDPEFGHGWRQAATSGPDGKQGGE